MLYKKTIVNTADSQIQILSPSVDQYSLAPEANTFLSLGAFIIKSHLQKEKFHLNKFKKLKTALMQNLLTGRRRVTELLKKRDVEAAP